MIYAFRVSFYKWGMGGAEKFVALRNYSTILKDSSFWQAFGNTIYFSIGVVPTSLLISLFIAVLLHQKIKGVRFFRTIYFLPVITSVIAVSMVWKWIYHPQVGLANNILQLFGVKGFNWLSEWRGILQMFFAFLRVNFPIKGPSLALYSLIIVSVWKGLGYNIILFLAGLENIPGQYYEAAKVDGATRWQVFRHITWPLLSPTTFFVLIMTTIVSFQMFAYVWMMTGPPAGGPLGTTNVLVYYLFDHAFNFTRYGYGTAVAFILFIIILILTLIQRKAVERKVFYG
ncbi:sugar ABC transporter permease [candidate division WOR-3 bacterium]|nr:sugar ABC transporter permease [candidate division WOR-3 bacterium]